MERKKEEQPQKEKTKKSIRKHFLVVTKWKSKSKHWKKFKCKNISAGKKRETTTKKICSSFSCCTKIE